MNFRFLACGAGLVALFAVPALGQPFSTVKAEEILSGLSSPVALTHSGDDRVFITERPGRIRILDGSTLVAQSFLDIDPRVLSGGERGLLSIAFHPNYASNGFFFVNYTNNSGDTVVSRFSRSSNPNRADASSERILLTIPQPFGNHNGGQLQFGPDGKLYVGMGDGGSGNDPQCYAQTNNTLLGKMLRLDVDQNMNVPPYHAVPSDNPFAGSTTIPRETFATGLRNPWRFSFDRLTGDLYIGDVGQSAREEIDFLVAPFQGGGSTGGENFGWRIMEGNLCNGSGSCPGSTPGCNSPEFTGPILEYSHAVGCSVTGGYVYRGTEIPELVGSYLYGDFCSGTIWAAKRTGSTWTNAALSFKIVDLSAFGEAKDGELYATSLDGRVYRFSGVGAVDAGSVEFTQSTYTASEDGGTVGIDVERTGSGDGGASVTVTASSLSATAGEDFVATAAQLSWNDGELGVKRLDVSILEDTLLEETEDFALTLTGPSAGLSISGPSARGLIVDNDVPSGPCQPSATSLCLNGTRFRLESSWTDFEGGSGNGTAVKLTNDSGYFWFFRDSNLELVVKVLDACGPFDRFWVFAAGLTNVEVELRVTDTETGAVKIFENPLGVAFQPIQDINAFATCP